MTFGFFESILLGLVQGLTEFFPISSSGHLVLAQTLLGVAEEGILMEVLLHLGTASVVVYFYREKVIALLRPVFDRDLNRYRLALVVGLLPTGLVGIFLKAELQRAYESPASTLFALGLTGTLLLSTRFVPAGERRISLWTAFLIGIAQSVAIFPGISRSGATISAALFLGVSRREAAEFSFLLSVPAILGAVVLTLLDLPKGSIGSAVSVPALAGTAAAIISGLVALRILVRTVIQGRFDRWGWYCIAVALFGALALGRADL